MVPAKAASVVLLKAAEKLGGIEQLAIRIGVRADVLRSQISGSAPVTEVEYLKAVDIVLGEEPPGPRPSARGPQRGPHHNS